MTVIFHSSDLIIIALSDVDGRRISTMVFDPLTNTLFWIDSRAQALMQTEDPSNGAHSNPIMIHDLRGLSPHGIALDICHRYLVPFMTSNYLTLQALRCVITMNKIYSMLQIHILG